jgi:hypothetical protein
MSAPPTGATQSIATTRAARWPWLTLALVLLVLVAFGLRVYALNWGLPYTPHPDEPSAANTVLRMIRRGDWNPRFFEKPSLYYYALRLVFAAHIRYGLDSGLYRSIADLPLTTDTYLTTPGLFVWGRMLSVILGALTLVPLYLIGRRWWGSGAGLAAAALLAVLPFAMRNSQYITVDAATALMALLALAATLRLLERPDLRTYALAGLLTGLAASTKYNAGALLLTLAAAHVAVWRRASLRRSGLLAWAGLWSLLGFVAGTPYALLTPGSFVAGIQRQYGSYAPAVPSDINRTWPVLGYLTFFWGDGLHPLPSLAALLGIGVVIARRDRAGLVLLTFLPPQLLFFLAQSRHFYRNLLPLIPPLALFAGIGIMALVELGIGRLRGVHQQEGKAPIPGGLRSWWLKLAEGGGQRIRAARSPAWAAGALALGLTVLVGIGPLLNAIELTRFYALPNSQVRAGDYVRDQLPHGAPIAVDLNPVQWANQPFITTSAVSARGPAWYRAQGYRYLVVNVHDADPAGYTALRQAAQQIQVFPGDREGQPGPHLELLDLGTPLDELAITRRDATFGARLRLLGFQRAAGELRAAFRPLDGAASVPRGQALLLNLYWQPLTRIDADYAIFLHLRDAQGHTVAQRDTLIRAADYPTSHWQPGELALDLADLPIPADLPPGTYQLGLGVYRMETQARLALPGAPEDTLDLMTVQVVR